MPNKIIIASDSTCDLSPELIKKYDIKILPMGVFLDGKQYTDGVDITPDMIYEHYTATGSLPKTAAINFAGFEAFYDRYVQEGYSIVLFSISSGMSSSYNNARLAAMEYENVYVVDTLNLSTGGGLLVLSAAEMAEQGKDAREIAEECARLAEYVDASFVIDSLEFLHKGGRCSALTAVGSNVLQIKPCIVVRDGKMGVGRKYRGRYSGPGVLPQYITDRIGDGSRVCLDKVFVTHAGCDAEIVDMCVAKVKELAPEANVMVTRAGCTVSSHCGKNTLGVFFIRKPSENL